jgi:hypothetical protein
MATYEVRAEKTSYYKITVDAQDREEAFHKACAVDVDKWAELQSPDFYIYEKDDDIREVE